MSATPPLPKPAPHTRLRTPAGNELWGEITIDIEAATNGKVKAGPILLFAGRHDGPNKGFGKIHIEAEHANDFSASGFDNFILSAVSIFHEIYQQKDKVVALLRKGTGRIQCVLEYREDQKGGYYSIVTAFRVIPGKITRGDLIWKK